MTEKKVTIIAEAGVNHNGDINIARKLIDAASDAGADFVKFQTFKAEKIVSKKAVKAEYQKRNLGEGPDTQFEMLKALELSDVDHNELKKYCSEKNIEFLSTPFDLESIDLLKNMGITIGKIPSGELTNLPYLRKMAAGFKTIILSTGMATMDEINEAVQVLNKNGITRQQITILHCNTEYPTPMRDVNLKAMLAIRDQFETNVGYSDHTEGIEVAVAAVALGATLIEKHFTLDRNMPGPDHKASLEPNELKAMIAAIRNIELAISGSGVKEPSPSEIKNKEIARKSIHAAKDLAAGTILMETDLIMKRPGTGLSPMKVNEVLGKKLVIPIAADEILTTAHIQ